MRFRGKIVSGVIVVGFLGIGGVYINSSVKSSTGKYRQEVVQKAARHHLSQLYPGQEVNIACSAADSNNDGYISCDFTVKGDTTVRSLECSWSYTGSVQEGCRSRLPYLDPSQRNR